VKMQSAILVLLVAISSATLATKRKTSSIVVHTQSGF
jgi:hypothetical protein